MVYFVRHGNKEIGRNYDEHFNRELNILDEPLSEKGREDAKRIAAYFEHTDIKRIFVSQYKRTHQTAAPTSLQKNITVIEDKRVNEINNGVLRNMSDEEVASAYPKLWSDFKNHVCDVQFPGGESGEDVRKRLDSFLDDLKHEKGDILVVSHDGFIRLLMCSILGLPVYRRYKFITHMGGISAIDYDAKDGEWKVITFNQALTSAPAKDFIHGV